MMPQDYAFLFRVDGYGPRLLFSNVIKNTALHLRWSGTAWNAGIASAVDVLHQTIRVSSTDARVTFPGHSFARIPAGISEDFTGNPLHLVLLVIAFALIFVRPSGQRNGDLKVLATASLVGFILFCGMVRWQMFHARLHLPFFVLCAPAVGFTLERKGVFSLLLMWFLLLWAFILTVTNPSHRLLGKHSIFLQPREAQYFTNRPGLYEPLADATDILAEHGCERIGISGGPVWEYPLWIMYHARTGRWPQIEAWSPSPPFIASNRGTSDFCAFVVLPVGVEVQGLMPDPDWPSRPLGKGVRLLLPRINRRLSGFDPEE